MWVWFPCLYISPNTIYWSSLQTYVKRNNIAVRSLRQGKGRQWREGWDGVGACATSSCTPSQVEPQFPRAFRQSVPRETHYFLCDAWITYLLGRNPNVPITETYEKFLPLGLFLCATLGCICHWYYFAGGISSHMFCETDEQVIRQNSWGPCERKFDCHDFPPNVRGQKSIVALTAILFWLINWLTLFKTSYKTRLYVPAVTDTTPWLVLAGWTLDISFVTGKMSPELGKQLNRAQW